MRILFLLLILNLLFTSCKEKEKQIPQYNIIGKAENIYNGTRVYLKANDEQGKQIMIDSAIVMNEIFKMNGSVDTPVANSLIVDGYNGQLIFMLENSDISIEINTENINQSYINGSKSNTVFVKFRDSINELNANIKNIENAYRKAKELQETKKADSIFRILEFRSKEIHQFPLNFIANNSNSFFSLNLIDLESNKETSDIESYYNIYNTLSDSIKNSSKGIEVHKKITHLYSRYKRLAPLEIGKTAPNFEAIKSDGNVFNITETKGKITVLNFWASWCKPCRKDNIELLKMYKNFQNEGFEIVSISLDGKESQSNPKEDWLSAINTDNLPWIHVSNLKYYNDPIALLYNIRSIPTNYLLDRDGKIIDKNIRGEALNKKVIESLNQ
ncbi:TlpA disulfide reductase family protein [Winogradskyella sp. SYSU M77433]|uniref:TlpA disulfide reductase family protein n=1 Tax=Winogradskyella sp. SYSU M77433 TaxID=3042722 RepID=UPI0024811120|nr:TlpA disulfide reductase family protein [Winogradskyella sp. SYSU M77433]MDH7912822.1 TlpA disulfide reductase family protein [Winogradskyella sp. SYSU M77433]